MYTLLQVAGNFIMSHVYREGNRAADMLTQLGYKFQAAPRQSPTDYV